MAHLAALEVCTCQHSADKARGQLGQHELVSSTGGGNVAVALEVAARPGMEGKRIVTIACSFAERYISSALFDGIG